MDNDKNIERMLSVVASNFLSASEMVNDARINRNEIAQELHMSVLNNAIVMAETAIEALKEYVAHFQSK
jgi:hypothetical protein